MESPSFFDLDHQRLVFGKSFKTFAWKSTITENCDVFQMTPTTCDNMFSPRVAIGIHETITVTSAELKDENDMYYYWKFVATDRDRHVCQVILPYIVVNESGR